MDVLEHSLSAMTTLRNRGIIDASEFDEYITPAFLGSQAC